MALYSQRVRLAMQRNVYGFIRKKEEKTTIAMPEQ